MTEPIKLCCDCRFYKKDWGARLTGYGDTFDLCLHPAVTENVVTGKSNGRYCDSVRKYYKCGMDGKLWEAKNAIEDLVDQIELFLPKEHDTNSYKWNQCIRTIKDKLR